jgi:hypothetical protein
MEGSCSFHRVRSSIPGAVTAYRVKRSESRDAALNGCGRKSDRLAFHLQSVFHCLSKTISAAPLLRHWTSRMTFPLAQRSDSSMITQDCSHKLFNQSMAPRTRSLSCSNTQHSSAKLAAPSLLRLLHSMRSPLGAPISCQLLLTRCIKHRALSSK